MQNIENMKNKSPIFEPNIPRDKFILNNKNKQNSQLITYYLNI